MASRYGIEIRAATPADAPGLADMLAEAGHPLDAVAIADRLPALRQAGTALIASRFGPPSGIVVLHWYAMLEEARPTARITTLVVAPEERRNGIGRLLLKAASQAARQAGCGTLELVTEAPSLRGFCRATGFAEEGSRFLRSLRKQG
ncbi:GNAT family N-acetyltransferase [Falsiroseomonas sp. HW251]|uniref:GNAT family N-acetyltransferase n=1 Tax=Falsiroseomonas sp. HW251 TaxID=3390998 RepID=UPI003D31BD46